MKSKRLKYELILLLTVLSLSVAACGKSRKVVNETSLPNTNNDEYGIEYYDEDNVDKENPACIKKFEPGEHVIMIKKQATVGYGEPVRFEAPEGYKISDIDYVENANGELGATYCYITITFENVEPVAVTGYYDKKQQIFIYASFGSPIEVNVKTR